MLKRLQNSKATYSSEKWETERLESLKLAGMRSKYDLQLVSKKDLLGLTKEEKVEMLHGVGHAGSSSPILGPLNLPS